jgi:hypothetical protein
MYYSIRGNHFVKHSVRTDAPTPNVFLAAHLFNIACIGIESHPINRIQNAFRVLAREFLELPQYRWVNA